jgi:hypothetical protein
VASARALVGCAVAERSLTNSAAARAAVNASVVAIMAHVTPLSLEATGALPVVVDRVVFDGKGAQDG